MDDDGSGTVDRLEWLSYLCSAGTDGKKGTRKDYYDFELREMFDKADRNRSCHLNQS